MSRSCVQSEERAEGLANFGAIDRVSDHDRPAKIRYGLAIDLDGPPGPSQGWICVVMSRRAVGACKAKSPAGLLDAASNSPVVTGTGSLIGAESASFRQRHHFPDFSHAPASA
jgi:hypothetical protein